MTILHNNLQRTAVSDVNLQTGRYARLGAGTATTIAGTVTLLQLALGYSGRGGIFVRYVDTNNWLMLVCTSRSAITGTAYWALYKRKAGVESTLASGSFVNSTSPLLTVDTAGICTVYPGDAPAVTLAPDADLATGGTLASGGYGVYDAYTSATALTRIYDDAAFWAPTIDQAIYANRSLEIRSDRVRRQDSAAATWGKPSYEGDYLLIPPDGPEQRTTRIITKSSRNPDADAGIDDSRDQLFITPRYWLAPPT